jgi:hypothetical protein
VAKSKRDYRARHAGRLSRETVERHQADPEKFNARQAVHRAVKSGRLVRGPCEECGATENVQGHHDDYSKPLDVRWLCPTCHAKEH